MKLAALILSVVLSLTPNVLTSTIKLPSGLANAEISTSEPKTYKCPIWKKPWCKHQES